MANFTTLTGAKTVEGSIRNWVNRSDIPASTILTEAEALIYETLRVREMHARSVLTFSAGTQSAALPTGFLDPIGFRPHSWGSDLPFVHEGTLNDITDEDGTVEGGTPSRWSIIGETAYVDVLPDEDFAGRLMFFKQPTALSLSNETNFLTNRYPSMLRYACMAKAYEHQKDDQAANYLALLISAIASASSSNEMFRRNQYVPG